MATEKRKVPNILITGTPGTGKSTLCEELAKRTDLEWLDVGRIAQEGDLYSGFDAELDCQILDEDRLLDDLEEMVADGGKIVDYHGCDFFPERWFDIVFVLSTNNTNLYDRLILRGYTETKLQNNLQCEIFHTLLDEARQSYKEDIVHQLPSTTPNDFEENLDKIIQWLSEWQAANGDN